MVENSYERDVIEFESALNKAMREYFNNRGLSKTTVQKNIFEAGFRMAWNTRTTDRDSVLEEAAKVAKGYVDQEWPNDDISITAEIIAKEIRNLK